MENIGQVYRSYLQEKVIKDFLYDGVTPTKSQIDQAMEVFEDENPGLSAPFTQPEVYEISESSKSSAKKVNKTFEAIYNDLAVMYTALVDQATIVTKTFDSISSELNLIKKKTSELETKASNLLFLAPESEGNLDFVSDSFYDKSKVDEVHSTALIDTATNRATLPASKFTRLNLVLADSDVQFNTITRDDFLSQELAPNSSLLNAFSDSDSIWLHRVRMRRGVGSVTAELILRVPNGGSEVNKIVVVPAASDEANIATVTVQFSNDGLNWSNAKGIGTARLIGDTSLVIEPAKATYWKFIFNKAGYDEYSQDSYLYEFGARSIQLYGVEYSNEQNDTFGVLYSNALIPSTGKEFNKVSLSVCETVPAGCTLQYYIAGLSAAEVPAYEAGTLDFDLLPFIQIDPQERKDKSAQAVIDYSKLDNDAGHSNRYSVSNAVDFRYKTRANLALDFTVDPLYVKDQLKVLRNIGDNTGTAQILSQDTGWVTDGIRYSTRLYVEADAGMVLDFGNTTAVLDGVSITGRVIIPKGYHSFSTDKSQWRKINPLDIGSSSNPDPLYPYNHKYLIEGISSSLHGHDLTLTVGGISKKTILDPNGVYVGADMYWASTLESVTNFDFTSNIADDNYGVYTILKDLNGVERIIVKHSDEPGLMVGENFAIITRSVNGDLQKAVILKAVFSSQNPKLTPILDEYIIKLGY